MADRLEGQGVSALIGFSAVTWPLVAAHRVYRHSTTIAIQGSLHQKMIKYALIWYSWLAIKGSFAPWTDINTKGQHNARFRIFNEKFQIYQTIRFKPFHTSSINLLRFWLTLSNAICILRSNFISNDISFLHSDFRLIWFLKLWTIFDCKQFYEFCNDVLMNHNFVHLFWIRTTLDTKYTFNFFFNFLKIYIVENIECWNSKYFKNIRKRISKHVNNCRRRRRRRDEKLEWC